MNDIAIDNTAHDIILDSNHDIVICDTTAQDKWNLLIHHKGEFKQYPMQGIGIEDIACDHELPAWKREIQNQLETIGMTVSKLVVKEDGLELVAKY